MHLLHRLHIHSNAVSFGLFVVRPASKRICSIVMAVEMGIRSRIKDLSLYSEQISGLLELNFLLSVLVLLSM